MRFLPDVEACVTILSAPDPSMATHAGETMTDIAQIAGLEIDAVVQVTGKKGYSGEEIPKTKGRSRVRTWRS